MYDVHVIGAGPSGSFAAATAAKNGHNVLLSEEHASIGRPVACSGLVSKSGLEAMSDLVDYKKISLNNINGAIVYAADFRFDIQAAEGDKAHVIDRGAFDVLAAQAAQSQGVRISTGDRVSAGQYKATNVIAADGPNSATARHFNFPKMQKHVICCQAEYEFDCDDTHKVQAYLSPSRYPGFFGWAIPNGDGSAKIGMGARLPHNISASFAAFTKRLGLEGKKSEGFLSAVIPISTRAKTAGRFGHTNVLLVGDAAGQVKATTGGGIFFGASCGRAAGANFENPQAYERAWRGAYGAELAAHAAVYDAMHSLGIVGHHMFFAGAKIFGAEKFLSKYGQMDMITKTFSLRNFTQYLLADSKVPKGTS